MKEKCGNLVKRVKISDLVPFIAFIVLFVFFTIASTERKIYGANAFTTRG